MLLAVAEMMHGPAPHAVKCPEIGADPRINLCWRRLWLTNSVREFERVPGLRLENWI
jgi:hypothetical protein